MELRSEGQMLADDVDLWYKDQFLDRLLEQKSTAQDGFPIVSAGRSRRWRYIFLTAIASVSLSIGPAIPSIEYIPVDLSKLRTVQPTACQTFSNRTEIICPGNHSQLNQLLDLLPVPSRLPQINP